MYLRHFAFSRLPFADTIEADLPVRVGRLLLVGLTELRRRLGIPELDRTGASL